MEKMPITKIPLHGKSGEGKFTLVDGDYDGEYFSQYYWRVTPQGYVNRIERERVGDKVIQHCIYLHREVCWTPKGMWVEHIDGDKLNNRSCNLRWRTPSEICHARKQRVVKSDGFRGVVECGKFYGVKFRGKQYPDRFMTPEKAAAYYDELASAYYGERAVLNRKEPALAANKVQGRPMANGGIKRQTKRLRKQIKKMLRIYEPEV